MQSLRQCFQRLAVLTQLLTLNVQRAVVAAALGPLLLLHIVPCILRLRLHSDGGQQARRALLASLQQTGTGEQAALMSCISCQPVFQFCTAIKLSSP